MRWIATRTLSLTPSHHPKTVNNATVATIGEARYFNATFSVGSGCQYMAHDTQIKNTVTA